MKAKYYKEYTNASYICSKLGKNFNDFMNSQEIQSILSSLNQEYSEGTEQYFPILHTKDGILINSELSFLFLKWLQE